MAATLLGAGTRDLSTPQKALLGHWRSDGGLTDVYISEKVWTSVEVGGVATTLNVTLLNTNQENRTIELYVKTKEGGGHYKFITIEKDGRKMTPSAPGWHQVTLLYRYIDDKTTP
jgi:hypothetical protein